MTNLTKNEVKAKLALLLSVSKLSNALFEELDETLSQNSKYINPSVSDLLLDVDAGVITLDEAMAKLDSLGVLMGLEEGPQIPLPYVEAINPICIEAGVQYPSGEKLTAFLAESDSGTYQAGSIYYTEKGTILDLSFSEIKKDSLTEGEGLSLDNKDIDIYVWGDAFNEDYTEKVRLSYKDIMRALEEDDLSETETPPVLK